MSEVFSGAKELSQDSADEQIDLKKLILVLWSGRRLIISVTGIAAILSVVLALSQPNIYTSTALLVPAENASGGVSGLMGQYSGLASLAGIAMPMGDGGSRAKLGMQLMKSRAFIGDFIARRDILASLLASKSWNSNSGELLFDPNLYDAESGRWVRSAKPPKSSRPSAQEAHRAFSKLLTVSQDKQTGYVSVSIDHQSPIIAATWVEWLVEDVNDAVKAQDVEEANNSIKYLKRQIANTPLADLQAMFSELIQSQTEIVMLAEIRSEYVFKTIDPAIVPEQKSKPNRALSCVLGTLLGGFIAVIVVLARYYLRANKAF